ncbi:hypothetical protein LX16_3158 [Stackebrandtia albiflava]|uniref:Uncharacterized protein n=1 Tax=Stackebrandtia albiflava TaxID=406432 RepID=A0A562V3D9_9ACTN|nr:hypothetical protein [Stackebrandtia albiflava]TWJ12401.1 hypothetical protein LX16_3158 [Stackebrandtia albiflava]
MPACPEHRHMDEVAFSAHVRALAVAIRDRVAERTARTVLKDAERAREAVRIAMGTDDVTARVPADEGYSLLDEDWRALVDAYRDDYRIDLLSFRSSDAAEAEAGLRDRHLGWIVARFTRGRRLPQPGRTAPPIRSLEEIAGTGPLIEVRRSEGGEIDVGLASERLGDGMLGAAVVADVGGVAAATTGWESETSTRFRDEFLPRIPTAAGNQINVLRAMRNLLGLHQGLLTRAREDVDRIAHDGLEAIESHDDCCPGGADTFPTGLGLTTGVTALADGVARLTGGGTGITLLGDGGGPLEGHVDDARRLTAAGVVGHELGGPTPEVIVEKIMTALDTTYRELDRGYTEIGVNGLGALAKLMADNPDLLRAPRPSTEEGTSAATPGEPSDAAA